MILYAKPLCIIATALLILTGFPSCKKDSKSSKSKTELLTAGSWKLHAFTISPDFDYDGDGTPDNDILSLYAPCTKDDLTAFKADGTATDDEGSLKCDPNDPQTTDATWSFNTDETKIVLDGEEYAVKTLSSYELNITFEEEDGGTTYVYSMTFVH